MNEKTKTECLGMKALQYKNTIWGDEIVAQMTGDSNIEIKILDGKNGPLSIQSHPNSWEIWKILEIEPGAFIIGGLKQEFIDSDARFYNDCPNIIPFCHVIFPKVNDMYLIPKGLIHALGKGIVALEIKPSINNETIRIYDWDRDREPQTLKPDTKWRHICRQGEQIIKLN